MKDTITITDGITVTIDLSVFNQAIIDNYNEDQLFDVLQFAINKRSMLKSTAFERISYDFKDELGDLLNKFFNRESDACKYLDATQQDKLVGEFYDWIND